MIPIKQNRENTEGYSRLKVEINTASSGKLVSTIGARQVPIKGTGPGVRKSERSLLAYHTCCKCSIETTHISVGKSLLLVYGYNVNKYS